MDKPVKKKLRLKDIANDAGVSLATVSAVYNSNLEVKLAEDTRRQIKDLLHKADYQLKVPRKKKGVSRGLSLRVVTDFPAQYFMRDEILAGIDRKLNSDSGRMILNERGIACAELQHDPDAFLEDIDGFIFISRIDKDSRSVLDRYGIPYVVVGTGAIDTAVNMVYPQYHEYIPEALKYLTGLGHRHIVYITGPFPHSCFERAVMFFHEYGEKYGIVSPRDNVRTITAETDDYAIISELLSGPVPDAIIGQIGPMRRFIEVNGYKAPEDISLLCFDCCGDLDNPLSNFSADNHLLGVEAVNLIHRLTAEPEAHHYHVSLPLRLVDCNTCRKI